MSFPCFICMFLTKLELEYKTLYSLTETYYICYKLKVHVSNDAFSTCIYLPRILLTQPLDTWRIRDISQGRAPEWASSTIFWRVESGSGRPLTYTPPNWLIPLWPAVEHPNNALWPTDDAWPCIMCSVVSIIIWQIFCFYFFFCQTLVVMAWAFFIFEENYIMLNKIIVLIFFVI